MNILPGGLSLILHVGIIVYSWIRDQFKKLWVRIQWVVLRRPQYGPVAGYMQIIKQLKKYPTLAPISIPLPPPIFTSPARRYLAFSIMTTLIIMISIVGWQLLHEAFQGTTNVAYASTAASKIVEMTRVHPCE